MVLESSGYGKANMNGSLNSEQSCVKDCVWYKRLLEIQNNNASLTNIDKVIDSFMIDEPKFITQPNALNGLFHAMFNPVTAQAAFNLFMQMRPKYVQQVPGMMAALPGGVSGGGIPTYNLGDPQYLMPGGTDTYAARLAMEERREMLEDKRFDKYMRNMMMINMQKMMGAQTPMIEDPSGMHAGMGAIREGKRRRGV